MRTSPPRLDGHVSRGSSWFWQGAACDPLAQDRHARERPDGTRGAKGRACGVIRTAAHGRPGYGGDMDSAPASSSSAGIGGRPRHGCAMLAAGLLVGGVLGVFLGALLDSIARGLRHEAPTSLVTTGRVVGPAGFDLTRLRMVASRDGHKAGQSGVDLDGGFRMNVGGDGPFDLYATDWRVWRDPRAAGAEPMPEVAMEGGVRNLAWGARGVLVRVEPEALAHVSILVRGPDGTPAAGATVWLRSLTDRVRLSANADGLAHFEGLPARSWRAVSRLPGGGETALVTGWRDLVPEGQVVEIRIPVGVRMFVRFTGPVPTDVELECEVPNLIHIYQTIPWRPDRDGRMAILVPPDCRSLSLRAREYLERTEDKTVTRTYAAGAIAVAEDAELVLEPLGR